MSADHQAAMKDDSNPSADKAPAEQAVKCPRCDSPNTKFCYYNNYSLTQPRHFCKTCRRYWTKGGALRNVPIGGGCRKNKKIKPSSSSSSSKFFTGGLSPAMDFQLGALSSSSSFPRLHHQYSGPGHYMAAQFSSSSALDSPGYALQSSLVDANYAPQVLGGAMQEMNNNNATSSSGLASSIESLSCINQDLHWKLQQQRLAMLFGNNKDNCTTDNNNSSVVPLDHHHQQQQQQQQKRNLMMQPIMFQNLDIPSKPEACSGADNSRKEAGGDVATEWFFGSSYANHTTGGGNNVGDHGMRTAGNWSTGVQGWSPDHVQQQHNQYTGLP